MPPHLFLATAVAPPAPAARRPANPMAPSAEAVSREPSCSCGRGPLTYSKEEVRAHQDSSPYHVFTARCIPSYLDSSPADGPPPSSSCTSLILTSAA